MSVTTTESLESPRNVDFDEEIKPKAVVVLDDKLAIRKKCELQIIQKYDRYDLLKCLIELVYCYVCICRTAVLLGK